MIKPAGIRLPFILAAILAATSPALAKIHHHADGAAPSEGAAGDNTATPMPAGPPPVPDSPAGDKSTPVPPTLPEMTARPGRSSPKPRRTSRCPPPASPN